MNAVRSVVERGLSSALIIEDDMDWDIRLLSQMSEFATGVRSLSGIPLTAPQDSPYGDDWDLLWPGHCGEAKVPWPNQDEPIYVINDDPTVAPKEHLGWLYQLQNFPDNTRIIHRGVQPICTFAYGVTRLGAQKILAIMAIKTMYNLPFDLQLALACRDRVLGLRCYSVEPMLFHHHRTAGPKDKDSDIQVKTGGDGAFREKGLTENIVLSARLNIQQMITGSEDYVMQW